MYNINCNLQYDVTELGAAIKEPLRPSEHHIHEDMENCNPYHTPPTTQVAPRSTALVFAPAPDYCYL